MSAWHSLAHAESAATGQSARSCPHFQVHVPVREADCRQLQSALDPGARLRPGLPGRGVRGRCEPAGLVAASGGGALLLPGGVGVLSGRGGGAPAPRRPPLFWRERSWPAQSDTSRWAPEGQQGSSTRKLARGVRGPHSCRGAREFFRGYHHGQRAALGPRRGPCFPWAQA